jgi:hypothetical protein
VAQSHTPCNRCVRFVTSFARDGGLAQHLAVVSLGSHSNLAITASPLRFLRPFINHDLLATLYQDNLRLGGAVPSVSELLSQPVLVF